GKFWEIIIIWSASYVTFTLLGLQYAMLLGVLVGLSVIIPYIGATVVTFPVLAVGWFQWGWTADFGWLALAYFIIQGLDGNVLVPLLFSEVVSLHPIAIIVAILVFGGFWGFWGVFFAIPLATLVNAVIQAWPSRAELDDRLQKQRA
ncbi:MAG TPA: AI-2E family transporter, partial [Thiolapillus brandeum]|nr:AI-2E family transporter [Thiolapillus brandeum]